MTRGSGASTTVFTDPLSTVRGRLTSDGALLVTEQLGHTQVRQLRNGTLSTVTDMNFIQDFEVDGDFATWIEFDLTERDQQPGLAGPGGRHQRRGHPTAQGSLPNATADLAPNGDLVYVQDGEVFRFRGGVSQQLTDNAPAGLAADFARTDGTLIVQAVADPCGGASSRPQLVLLDPGGDVVLGSAAPGSGLAVPGEQGLDCLQRATTSAVWRRSGSGRRGNRDPAHLLRHGQRAREAERERRGRLS